MILFWQHGRLRWQVRRRVASLPTPIAARERWRKSRLQAILLLWTLPVNLIMVLDAVCVQQSLLPFTLYLLCGTLVTIWWNQHGHPERASWLYLGNLSLSIGGALPQLTPDTRLIGWMGFALTILLAGLLLPWRVPLLMALLHGLLVIGWYHSDATPLLPAHPTLLVVECVCLLFAFVGVISALFSWSTTRAIVQADRAVDLEAAHQQLQEQHTSLQQLHAHLASLVVTNPLTGLANHRGVIQALDQEIARLGHTARPFALLFFDLDHFKAINDTYGHAGGDIVLCEFARIARTALRNHDLLGRWGGEEFLALLPEVTPDEAATLAEAVRLAVATHGFPVGQGIQLTCSIGYAVWGQDSADRDALVAAADHAMYAAKSLGRNQVRAAADPLVALVEQTQQRSWQEEIVHGMVIGLVQLVAERDAATGTHLERVGALVAHVAQQMGCTVNEVQMIAMAGQLHDLGKVAIPDRLLQCADRLTATEQRWLERHPVVGAEVLQQIPPLRALAAIVRGHHERWDGTGYPDGLLGEQIPLAARLIAVVDAYDAMTSGRPYAPARPAAWAQAEIQRCAGTQFDPQVVAAFLTLFQEDQQAA